MNRLRMTALLLMLALLGGQWLAIAHSAEHVTLQADDTLCVLCVHAHDLEQAQADSHPAVVVETAFLAPGNHAPVTTTAAHRGSANIRAPPFSVHN